MWYSGLLVSEKNFGFLSRRFASLIRELVGNRKFYVNVVKEHPAPASVNLDNLTITVDKEFFDGTHQIYGDLTWNERLEFCAGVCVHEGAHIAYTPKNWLDFHLPIGKMPRNDVSISVANVVEDIFIESNAKLANNNFAYIIDFVSSLLFSDDEINKRRLLWNGEKPNDDLTLTNAINYMITWKRRNVAWFFLTEFERTLYNLFVSASNVADPRERGNITQKILTILLGKEECEKQAKDDKNSSDNLVMVPGGKLVHVDKNKKTPEVLRTDFALTEKSGSSTEGFYILDVNPPPSFSASALEKVDFSGFSRIVQARGSQRAIKGIPSSSGNKIRNLLHFEEGKIFGEMKIEGDRVGKGKQDIVVLVDLSGSMNANIPRTTKRKVTFALECACGLASAFEKEGFNYAILGHTESWVPGELAYNYSQYSRSVVMYRFKGLKERKSAKEVVNSLEWMHSVFRGGGNNDSLALFLASQEFVQQNDKIIIVISDGEATEFATDKLLKHGIKCPGNAVGDTKAVVDYLRKERGINVFSLAIDNLAITPCEIIYGEKFNSTAFNPQDFVNAIINFTE